MSPRMLDDAGRSVWTAARGLRRSPGFAAAAVLTMAVGLAGTTAMFTVFQGILLRPLPVPEQHRLVVSEQVHADIDSRRGQLSREEIASIQRESRVLDTAAGVGYNDPQPVAFVERDAATFVQASRVTGTFFTALGAPPLLGRTLRPSDDVAGAEGALVITHALWQRRYGGAHDVLGTRVILNRHPFTIVGVMPPDVEYPRHVEAWMTVAAMQATAENDTFRGAVASELNLLARLRPGTRAEDAEAEVRALARQIEGQRATVAPRGINLTLQFFAEAVVGDTRQALGVLLGAVGLVLLIACANTANLLLLRGESRAAELAVRSALGAGRSRIVGELVAEAALLVVIAGGVALASVTVLLPALLHWLPEGLPRLDAIRVDTGVVSFSIGVSVVSALLAGVVPAFAVTRVDAVRLVSGAGRSRPGTGLRRGRQALVMAQVALAVTALAGALLLVRTVKALQDVGASLDVDRLVHVPLTLPPASYGTPERRERFMTALIERLDAHDAVAGATPINATPFSGMGWDLPVFTAEGQSRDEALGNGALNFEEVYPRHFHTLGIAIERGRSFTPDDRRDSPLVAVITAEAAARTWPGEDAIGRRVKLGGPESPADWRTIVGVAAPSRFRTLTGTTPSLYVPAAQLIATAHDVVVRSTLPPAAVMELVRSQARALDPQVQVMPARLFAELLGGPLARPRVYALLSTLFGATGLGLAAIGLYAVLAAGVRSRSREIGIRMAVGATAGDVRRLVVGDAAVLVGCGAAIGAALIAAAARVIAGLLYDVRPADPISLAGTAVLLLVVSALALSLPLRRACRIDPATLLRAE